MKTRTKIIVGLIGTAVLLILVFFGLLLTPNYMKVDMRIDAPLPQMEEAMLSMALLNQCQIVLMLSIEFLKAWR